MMKAEQARAETRKNLQKIRQEKIESELHRLEEVVKHRVWIGDWDTDFSVDDDIATEFATRVTGLGYVIELETDDACNRNCTFLRISWKEES